MGDPSNETSAANGVSTMLMLGGVCAGSGVMSLLFGFEATGGNDIATQISTVGFNSMSSIIITTYGKLGFCLLALGVAMMVAGNSRSWKSTGGY